MNSETLNSLLRTVLALLGAFVAGKGLKFFGVELDGAYWQEITGTVITLATLIWGFVTKTVDEEKGEAAIKTILTFVLAIFATNKLLDSSQVVAILTAIGALLPFLWSYLSKKKTEGIVRGNIKLSQLVKTTKMLAVLIMLGVCANAQEFFGSMSKPAGLDMIKAKVGRKFLVATDVPPTVVLEKNEFRPAANIVSTGYQISHKGSATEPGVVGLVGLGVGYGHYKYSLATDKWVGVWNVNGLLWAAKRITGQQLGDAFYGLTLGLWDSKVMFGGATDSKDWLITLGVGIPLNNL